MSTTLLQLINLAAENIGLMQPGGSLSAPLQADFLLRINTMWLSWGAEELVSNIWYNQAFTLTAGTDNYIVGTGGSLASIANPLRITGWRSVSGNFSTGGKPLSYAEFSARAVNQTGRTSQLVEMMAADNDSPYINIRVFPTPSSLPGSLILEYYAAFTAFSSVSDVIDSMSSEYKLALWTNFALLIYPAFGRAGYDPTMLAGLAQAAKATIVTKNAAILQGGAPQQGA